MRALRAAPGDSQLAIVVYLYLLLCALHGVRYIELRKHTLSVPQIRGAAVHGKRIAQGGEHLHGCSLTAAPLLA